MHAVESYPRPRVGAGLRRQVPYAVARLYVGASGVQAARPHAGERAVERIELRSRIVRVPGREAVRRAEVGEHPLHFQAGQAERLGYGLAVAGGYAEAVHPRVEGELHSDAAARGAERPGVLQAHDGLREPPPAQERSGLRRCVAEDQYAPAYARPAQRRALR